MSLRNTVASTKIIDLNEYKETKDLKEFYKQVLTKFEGLPTELLLGVDDVELIDKFVKLGYSAEEFNGMILLRFNEGD